MTYVLMLNDMRLRHYEETIQAAKADTPEELEALLARERVPFYQDGRWAKHFRAGGPLEWFNPPEPEGFGGIRRVGDFLERS